MWEREGPETSGLRKSVIQSRLRGFEGHKTWRRSLWLGSSFQGRERCGVGRVNSVPDGVRDETQDLFPTPSFCSVRSL